MRPRSRRATLSTCAHVVPATMLCTVCGATPHSLATSRNDLSPTAFEPDGDSFQEACFGWRDELQPAAGPCRPVEEVVAGHGDAFPGGSHCG